MAKIKDKKSSQKNAPMVRVSPLKPTLRGAQNWTASKVRAAGHSKKSFAQFCGGVFAIVMMLAVVALWMGGYWPTVIKKGTIFKENSLMSMGFVVERVDVMGEGRLNEQEVLAAVGILPGDYFFGVDLEKAQRRTESLPWVDSAVVRRLWPNRIVVQLVENQPYAVWQKDGELSLVNAAGKIIAPVTDQTSIPKNIIHVVGVGAAQNAEGLDEEIKKWPGLRDRVLSAVFVSESRWNLQIKGNVTVMLPPNNVDVALARLAELQAKTRILDREVSYIDLRINNRISIRPTTQKNA